jgi:hypothetical protein
MASVREQTCLNANNCGVGVVKATGAHGLDNRSTRRSAADERSVSLATKARVGNRLQQNLDTSLAAVICFRGITIMVLMMSQRDEPCTRNDSYR